MTHRITLALLTMIALCNHATVIAGEWNTATQTPSAGQLPAIVSTRLQQIQIDGLSENTTRIKTTDELVNEIQRLAPPATVAAGAYRLSTVRNTHSVADIEKLLIKHHTNRSLATRLAPQIMKVLKSTVGKRFLIVTSAVAGAEMLYQMITEKDQMDTTSSELLVLNHVSPKPLGGPLGSYTFGTTRLAEAREQRKNACSRLSNPHQCAMEAIRNIRP